MDDRSLARVEVTIGAVIGTEGEGGGDVNKGDEEGAGEERTVFKALTGHKGEVGREGIWTTWCLVEPCIAFAHFTMM